MTDDSSRRVRDFILALATDPALARKLATDPSIALEDSDLTDDERSLFLGRDPATLVDYLFSPEFQGYIKPTIPDKPSKGGPRVTVFVVVVVIGLAEDD